MTRIVNIMPMAGLGKRFLNSDFKLPKPLIKINNKPMFIQSAKSMPKSDLNIFICNKNLISNYKIQKIITKEYKKKFKIISVKRTTKGQANTCLLAEKYLKKNDKIFIHSCDSLIKYNSKDLSKKIHSSDAIILTTKPNKIHLKNIKSYGWVKCINNKISKITCKTKASLNPKKDFVIVGSFAFKNKTIFSKTIKSLFKSKKKINNEYYMDMVFSNALNKNYHLSNLIVKSYISWGTPQELLKWKKNSGKI
tara:strand:- start:2304 stop:3056 length:753 start_codon:yes stop_codon:yes gene_type:complete